MIIFQINWKQTRRINSETNYNTGRGLMFNIFRIAVW